MKSLLAFFKGFFYAGRGVFNTVFHERNMRVHLVFLVYMFSILLLTDWFELSKGDWVALVVASGIVISGELVNTAIEHAVDLASGEHFHPHAKAAKDAAAGGVLVSAICAVIVGIIILFQPSAFSKMFEYFSSHILSLIIFIISVIISVLFVFLFGKKNKSK